MKLCDLIYNYAEYCRVNVDAALLMENWLDDDYDEKYANYLQEYFRLKPLLAKSKDIKAAILLLQKQRVNETYGNVLGLMLGDLKKTNVTISDSKVNAIRNRLLKAVPVTSEINYDFVNELRKIEEEEY